MHDRRPITAPPMRRLLRVAPRIRHKPRERIDTHASWTIVSDQNNVPVTATEASCDSCRKWHKKRTILQEPGSFRGRT